MKTQSEIAETSPHNSDALKRRATQIKRVAGGIRTELVNSSSNGLTTAEAHVLQKALALLESMATNFAKAANTVRARVAKRVQIEKQVHATMASTFRSLGTIADRLALIAAVQSYQLREGRVKTADDLDYYFNEAYGALAYSLAGKATNSTVKAVVDDAWSTFVRSKDALIKRHASIVQDLQSSESKPHSSLRL